MDTEPMPRVVPHDARVETLFNRIAVARTHYDVLGVSADADVEEICNARLAAHALLHPLTLTPQAIALLARLNHSYRVLADAGRRRDYDYHLCAVDAARFGTPGQESRIPDHANQPVRQRQTGPLSFTSEFRPVAHSEDRRRYKRFGLTVPVYIKGYDPNAGWWTELTQTIDVSRTGLSFYIRHGVSPDTTLHLTFAMPNDLRAGQFQAPDYSIYAVVRRVAVVENGVRTIAAVMFIGDRAPREFGPPAWTEYPTHEPAESAEALAWC